VERSNSSQL